MKKNIVVVGAGASRVLAAYYLTKAGHRVINDGDIKLIFNCVVDGERTH